ncbi:hypothetical protein KGF54_002641 [Candida jiufengensis]|uniref:uncharacterized protein n=1 Tax=Candida jiufengensis TaxID=497108 RepID=UPI0022254278|nr:uncharacterized protein KGF54_002641 [Candida jiufengensis]KAI5953270.1 hypothetical protein KGF54_002641 [Candida jiufengensis]
MSRSVSISGVSNPNNKSNLNSYNNLRSASIGGSTFFNNSINNDTTIGSDQDKDLKSMNNQDLYDDSETNTVEKEIDIVGAISTLHLDEDEDDDTQTKDSTINSDKLESTKTSSNNTSSIIGNANHQLPKQPLHQAPYFFNHPYANHASFTPQPSNNFINNGSGDVSTNWMNQNNLPNGVNRNGFVPNSENPIKTNTGEEIKLPYVKPFDLPNSKDSTQLKSQSNSKARDDKESTNDANIKEHQVNFQTQQQQLHPHQFNPFPPSPIGHHPGAPPPPMMPFNYGPLPPHHPLNHQSPTDYQNFDLNIGQLPPPPQPGAQQPHLTNGGSVWNNNNNNNNNSSEQLKNQPGIQNPNYRYNNTNNNINGYKNISQYQHLQQHPQNNFMNNNSYYTNGHNNRRNNRNGNFNNHHNHYNNYQNNRNHNHYQRKGEDASKYFNHKAIDFKGSILNLCIDQHGCRFLQKELEEDGENQEAEPKEENEELSINQTANLIFEEIQLKLVDLMIDPFGNYLIQKLIKYLSSNQLLKLIELTSNDFYLISINSHGTRTLQKLIENCNTKNQIELIIQSLKSYVIELSNDLNGNHVIQKCLTNFNNEQNQFIYDLILKNLVVISCHRHGCCVLQKALDFGNTKQNNEIFKEISKNVEILIYDPYGNYVIQYILNNTSKENETNLNKIIEYIKINIIKISTHKFSSNVIEKLLKQQQQQAPEQQTKQIEIQQKNQEILINEILKLSSNDLNLILKDSYGNYVLQTCLNFANLKQLTKLSNLLLPLLPQIKNTPYGRRILNKLQ